MNKLWEAIDVINERGWTRLAAENDDGVCLIGAIRRAHGLNNLSGVEGFLSPNTDAVYADFDIVKAVIHEQYPDFSAATDCELPGFNDRQAESKTDVIRVLEKAAIKKDELV